jgi:hypothetical protein
MNGAAKQFCQYNTKMPMLVLEKALSTFYAKKASLISAIRNLVMSAAPLCYELSKGLQLFHTMSGLTECLEHSDFCYDEQII